MKLLKRAAILLIVLLMATGCFFVVYQMKYTDIVIKYSSKFNLSPALVCGVIHAESRFNKDAVSPKGASGLMQLTRTTAEWGARELGLTDYNYDNVFEPETNIMLGCWYLSKLYNQYGDMDVALAAYNAGSGNVSRWLNDDSLSDGAALLDIPFPETKNYLGKVHNNMRIYNVLLTIFGGFND